jgi:adenylate cyclase
VQFRSFKTRLLVLFLGLLTAVQIVAFVTVIVANIGSARDQIDRALEDTARTFRTLMQERTHSLLVAARLLSADFAFKKAYATREHGTVLSALENHRQRIGADFMMLVSLDETVLADTLHRDRRGGAFPYDELLDAAYNNEYGEAAGVVAIDEFLYQMVVVPLLVPTPDAWIAVGFPIDDRMATGLREVSSSQVSFVHHRAEREWHVVGSTLAMDERKLLPQVMRATAWNNSESTIFDFGTNRYVSLVTTLGDTSSAMVVVLQRSLAMALAPTFRLGWLLAALFAVGLVASSVAAAAVARNVTRPVLSLADGARRVREGDYNQRVDVDQKDELGELADSFNTMTQGLAERDQVRDLLGKVVSSAIAEELMTKGVELGGEERRVTILFSDIRNFTSLSENLPPKELLAVLNTYLTRISHEIERHGGVVDKYIGDAVMALFGAPLKHGDDAARALRAAMGMCHALQSLNEEFARDGRPQIGIGIGINTADVVAGNMGSASRLNYTVIGDGVNLASRLEGLTKYYGVSVVVSDETRLAAPEFAYRFLDRARVKGKRAIVDILQPLAPSEELDAARQQVLAEYHAAIELYRQRDFRRALVQFSRLAEQHPGCRPYQLYLERVQHYLATPPPPDWDGVFEHRTKG